MTYPFPLSGDLKLCLAFEHRITQFDGYVLPLIYRNQGTLFPKYRSQLFLKGKLFFETFWHCRIDLF